MEKIATNRSSHPPASISSNSPSSELKNCQSFSGSSLPQTWRVRYTGPESDLIPNSLLLPDLRFGGCEATQSAILESIARGFAVDISLLSMSPAHVNLLAKYYAKCAGFRLLGPSEIAYLRTAFPRF